MQRQETGALSIQLGQHAASRCGHGEFLVLRSAQGAEPSVQNAIEDSMCSQPPKEEKGEMLEETHYYFHRGRLEAVKL